MAHQDSSSRPQASGTRRLEKLSGGCGLTVVQRRRGTHRGRAVRVLCKTKGCDRCGPEYRRRRAAHFTEATSGTQLYRASVTAETWARLRKRLSGQADYVRVPAPDGRYVVLTTAPRGEVVADAEEALTSAFAAMPVDRRNVTSSRAWAEVRKEEDQEEPEATRSRWELVGVSYQPVAEVARLLDGAGLLRGEVRRADVEGWYFTVPDDEAGVHALRAVYDDISLHRPHRRRGLTLAA